MLEIAVLGPLEVSCGGRRVAVAGRRAERVLTTLALAEGRPVGVARLVDCVWGELPPRTAAAQLQTVVWRLRGSLADVGLPARAICQRTGGYLLLSGIFATDLTRFRRDVNAARGELAQDRPDRAAAVLRSALGRWRGPALFGTAEADGALAASAERLEEERQRAHEQCLRLDVVRGRHHAVIVELRELTDLYPLREPLYGTLAMALYRCGRQGDALEVLRQARERLRDGLGLDPGRELRDLERAILRQEAGLSPAGHRLELRQIERALEG